MSKDREKNKKTNILKISFICSCTHNVLCAVSNLTVTAEDESLNTFIMRREEFTDVFICVFSLLSAVQCFYPDSYRDDHTVVSHLREYAETSSNIIMTVWRAER